MMRGMLLVLPSEVGGNSCLAMLPSKAGANRYPNQEATPAVHAPHLSSVVIEIFVQ